ncbi:AGE family epimerase/isomerase [Flaviflexus massiliensis]|uniref:AGE family epimerase/isomerase n=1 Tax=Flaviflexus massiliensis TaxID=1522309 RepID=UPI0006D5B26C|nr:AGE family epimerase/isomerase [Flaviflexus massiliensis]
MTRWQNHLEKEILPWWVEHGDDNGNGVLTCFDNNGDLLETTKYTWSQGRWAWLASELATEGENGFLSVNPRQWHERAIGTGRFLSAHSLTGDGQTSFRTTRDGEHLPSGADGNVSTSVFADLFAVMGLSGAIRSALAEGRDDTKRHNDDSVSDWQTQANLILQTAHSSIRDGSALSEPYPVPSGFRDLAGPMTLLHASSEHLRADAHSEVAREAQQWALDALLGRGGMLHQDSWWEFQPLTPDRKETLLARHRTPGHLIELAWMIIHASIQARERGENLPVDIDQLARLALRACEIGWDPQQGGMLRYTDQDGGVPTGPLLDTDPGPYEKLVLETWDTKLWWVHSEAMYGTALLAQLTDNYELRSWSRQINDWTMRVFPEKGHEWIQIRTREGLPLNSVVALPVKDPMHIARSLLFLNRLTKQGQ